MQINIKAKNMDLTEAIRDYVTKRVTNLEKLLVKLENKGGEAVVHFEVGKSTNHHKLGDVFHSDCLVRINGEEFYSSADGEDLYQTVDEVKETLFYEINKEKDRKQTLFHRGARSVKKMLKGLSKRNPFTSKY
jgi:putative sigma-54 modulation protein